MPRGNAVPTPNLDTAFDASRAETARKEHRFANVAVGCFSLILTLFLAELTFRFAESRIKLPLPTVDRPHYFYLPHKNVQDEKYFLLGGARDYLYSLEKPADTFRVIAIGDSFTYPPGMQFDDAYPKRLERMLNLQNAPDAEKTFRRAEVLNFGHWGDSTEDEIKRVRHALRYNPNLILLEITLNDAGLPGYAKEVHEKFHPWNITPQEHPVLYYWRSLGYAVTRIRNTITNRKYIQFHEDLFNAPESWGRFAAALREIKQLCDAKGVPVAAFIFPFIHYSFDASYPFRDVHAKITGELDSLKIPNTDLLSAFKGVPPERLILEPGKDQHPNEIAHRIVAENLYVWLEGANLIPPDIQIFNKLRRTNSGRLRRIRRFDPTPDGDTDADPGADSTAVANQATSDDQVDQSDQ